MLSPFLNLGQVLVSVTECWGKQSKQPFCTGSDQDHVLKNLLENTSLQPFSSYYNLQKLH